ncbi:MAG: long-chain fatty acid--CoA ligase [Planctomycetes bacterium]|nr:long-chain fatty acid--CoA ligase [Planctomycetota bacterium]
MQERIWHRFYEKGVPASVPFEDDTLIDFFEKSAREHPDAPAVVFMNCKLTYAQLKDQVDRLATALAAKGVVANTSVAIQLPNLPQTVISFLAVLSLGAQAVMTNPLYMPPEIEHQWNDAGCEIAIVADYLYDQKVRSLKGKLPVREYIIASIPEYLRFPLNLLAPLKLKKADPPLCAKVAPGTGISFFKDLVKNTTPTPSKTRPKMDDVAAIQYTGGTTGVSKGAMLTHRNLSCNLQQVQAWFQGVEVGKEVLLAALPYFHIFGLTICMAWPLQAAACLVLVPNPRDIPGLIKSINKHRVTLFPAVPAMFNAINQYPGIDKIDLSSVKSCFSGSAPLTEDVQLRFESLTGAKIVEGFGLTETSPVVTCNPLEGKRKIGHIGIPFPSTDARVVDADEGKREMPFGQEGELIVKGPQIMKGYWKRPEATAEMIKDGWLYTGDLAIMDEEGYLRIVGRKKDMIIAGGYNIYPDEIDRVLQSHSAVFESCTIGVPDQKRGESVKAFVVFQPGESATTKELDAWCRERLAAYKVPREYVVREELPKSSMMKLLRRVLRDEDIKNNG